MVGAERENKLSDWDISRDAPYFGFEIPMRRASISTCGWMHRSATWPASRTCAINLPLPSGRGARGTRAKLDFDEYWDRPTPKTEMYHFIGKDILYFHALFWPATLKYSGFRTPTKLFAHGFLTVNGEKMSKSRGTFITADSYLKQGLNPEYLRYYYAAMLNGTMGDIDLNLGFTGKEEKEGLVAKVDSDLIGKYINLASRAAGFISKRFDGKLAASLSLERQRFLEGLFVKTVNISGDEEGFIQGRYAEINGAIENNNRTKYIADLYEQRNYGDASPEKSCT